MISCDSLPDIHWFYYCYIVIHRRGDTSPHLLLFYRISWVYRRVSPLLWTITSSCISAWRRVEIKGDSIVSGDWWCENVKMWNCEIVVFPSKNENVKMWNCENVKLWNRGVFVKTWKGENVKLWKCENVKSWCFRQKEKKEKRRNLPLRAASNGAVPDTFWYSPIIAVAIFR